MAAALAAVAVAVWAAAAGKALAPPHCKLIQNKKDHPILLEDPFFYHLFFGMIVKTLKLEENGDKEHRPVCLHTAVMIAATAKVPWTS